MRSGVPGVDEVSCRFQRSVERHEVVHAVEHVRCDVGAVRVEGLGEALGRGEGDDVVNAAVDQQGRHSSGLIELFVRVDRPPELRVLLAEEGSERDATRVEELVLEHSGKRDHPLRNC